MRGCLRSAGGDGLGVGTGWQRGVPEGRGGLEERGPHRVISVPSQKLKKGSGDKYLCLP